MRSHHNTAGRFRMMEGNVVIVSLLIGEQRYDMRPKRMYSFNAAKT